MKNRALIPVVVGSLLACSSCDSGNGGGLMQPASVSSMSLRFPTLPSSSNAAAGGKAPNRVPTILGRGVFDFADFERAGFRFVERSALFDADSTVAGCGGQETADIAFNGRMEMQDFVDRIVARPAQP